MRVVSRRRYSAGSGAASGSFLSSLHSKKPDSMLLHAGATHQDQSALSTIGA
jgi:hypothetical protein